MSVINLSTLTVDYTLPRYSAVVFTITTRNSTYVLTVGGFATTLVCTRGTFAGQTFDVDPSLVDIAGVERPLTGTAWEILARPTEPNRPALVARLKERFEGASVRFVSYGHCVLETSTVTSIAV